jgi:Bacterial Ig-like domain (group 2)
MLVGFTIQYPSSGLGRLVLTANSFSFSLLAFAIDADGVYQPLTNGVVWTTSDPTVLRSSPTSSTFTPAGVGTAEVYATYRGFFASIPVVVIDRVGYPYLDIDRFALPATGGTSLARAVVAQSGAVSLDVTEAAVWSSSNNAVATVTRGRVTGVAPGNTQITATHNGAAAFYLFSVPPRTRFQ